MNINDIVNKILEIDLNNIHMLNEYSENYKHLPADKIMEKLNENKEYQNLSEQNKIYRDELSKVLQSITIYLTGKDTDNGFLVDTAKVKKDNTYALFIYTALEEINEDTHYIEVNYNDLRDYVISSKEIKRIILNKNSVNVILGKSNFIRGNMYGLLIKNKLELE